MASKLRQITDTVHGTVYLSELESQLMSTAYFYRLHDIYQSSTVYLTFPCNRTKRYEHSYGTMSLASTMFFSAITNANNLKSADVDNFLSQGADRIEAVLDGICREARDLFLEDWSLNWITRACGDKKKLEDTIIKNTDTIHDLALEHFWPNFNGNGDLRKQLFTYQCLLQAIRIVALFHDVGHPPYSHILESVIEDLYKNRKDKFPPAAVAELEETLGPYFTKSECLGHLNQFPQSDDKFHERVGVKTVQLALQQEIQATAERMRRRSPERFSKKDIAVLAYYAIVAQFVLSIWCESDSYFSSLHRIVDGFIDADRLDYIVRDTANSGTSWGRIPYHRILESAQLFKIGSGHESERYTVAFPKKLSDDIEDIFVLRYKISARINFHHRSIKTSLLLQEIVRRLAEGELREKKKRRRGTGNSLCPEISVLWNSVALKNGEKSLSLIQWNDSVLIAHLYETLVKMEEMKVDVDSENEQDFDDQSSTLFNMLQEFLLNKKFYYSVYKRQFEISELVKSVYSPYLNLLARIHAAEEHDSRESGQHNGEQIAKHNAPCEDELQINEQVIECDEKAIRDSKMRLEQVQSHVEACDIDILEHFFVLGSGSGDGLENLDKLHPGLKDALQKERKVNGDNFPQILVSCVTYVLEQYKKDKRIKSYLFQDNSKVRNKTGTPGSKDKKGTLYVYEKETSEPYDFSDVTNQLTQLKGNFLYLCAYIEPVNVETCEKTISEIRSEVQKCYSDYLKAVIKALWPRLSIQCDDDNILR